MPSLSSGQNASLVLTPGESYTISTTGSATVRGVYGAPSITTTLTANFAKFGPYGVPAKLDIACQSGVSSYALDQFDGVPVTAKINNLTGGVELTAGGAVIPIGESNYTLPPATLRITAAQIVVGKSCKFMSVKCIAGAAITLTVYDNQTLPAGTVLFSQAMSAGDDAVIPSGIQAINGIYASFAGTATFDFGVQDAA